MIDGDDEMGDARLDDADEQRNSCMHVKVWWERGGRAVGGVG